MVRVIVSDDVVRYIEAALPVHVFSLSEKALADLRETHSEELFSHNRVSVNLHVVASIVLE